MKRFNDGLPAGTRFPAGRGPESGAAAERSARTFSLTVSGALLDGETGPAVFGPTLDEGGPAFAVVMGDQRSEHTLVLARNGFARPSVGRYAVQPLDDGSPPDDGWSAVYIAGADELFLGLFVGSGGEIEVTRSTDERLQGRFRIVVEGSFVWDPTLPATMTLTGSFDAGSAPLDAVVAAVQAAAF